MTPAAPAHDPFSGSHSAEYATPPEFFERVNRVWRFTLDVCATHENTKCLRFFAPEVYPVGVGFGPIVPAALDGLAQDWSKDVCWMNPPYNKPEAVCRPGCSNKRCLDRGRHSAVYVPGLYDWIKKAVAEAKRGAVIVALLPAGTDTDWYHELVAPNARVVPVRGRITFLNAPSGAKTPSMLCEFLPPGYGDAR